MCIFEVKYKLKLYKDQRERILSDSSHYCNTYLYIDIYGYFFYRDVY